MTLLIILACVFGIVALMVILGERFGKPMSDGQQAKFSKISWVLVFMVLVGAIIKEALK
jgi:amino acid permease